MNVTVNCTKTNKPQHFEVRFESIPLVTTSKIIERDGYGSDKADLHTLKQNLKDVKEAGWSSIKIIPLTDEGATKELFGRSTFHYRGGKKYISAGQHEEDQNAFVIRGKKIGQTSAHVWKDCDTGIMNIRFMAEDYGDKLTDNQANELNERFGKGLLDALTSQVLETVKEETVSFMLEYSKRDIKEIRERLDDLEKFKG